MLNKILEHIETTKQNQTGTEKFDIVFSVFFDCYFGSFLAGRLGPDYIKAQFLDLSNFSQDLQIK